MVLFLIPEEFVRLKARAQLMVLAEQMTRTVELLKNEREQRWKGDEKVSKDTPQF